MMNIQGNENLSFGMSEIILGKISEKHRDSVNFVFTVVKNIYLQSKGV